MGNTNSMHSGTIEEWNIILKNLPKCNTDMFIDMHPLLGVKKCDAHIDEKHLSLDTSIFPL